MALDVREEDELDAAARRLSGAARLLVGMAAGEDLDEGGREALLMLAQCLEGECTRLRGLIDEG